MQKPVHTLSHRKKSLRRKKNSIQHNTNEQTQKICLMLIEILKKCKQKNEQNNQS